MVCGRRQRNLSLSLHRGSGDILFMYLMAACLYELHRSSESDYFLPNYYYRVPVEHTAIKKMRKTSLLRCFVGQETFGKSEWNPETDRGS